MTRRHLARPGKGYGLTTQGPAKKVAQQIVDLMLNKCCRAVYFIFFKRGEELIKVI